MDFDEYDYLEKAVEETNGSSKKESPGKNKDRERSERRREKSVDDDEVDQEERERKRSSKKSRSEDKERDRDKERERDRERSSMHRSRDRDSERRSSRDKERDGERDKRDGEKREKERERRERERERERERRSRSSSRRYKNKKEAAEPEADPERDQRTVFAYQMPLKANERDVFEFFSKAGKVRDVRLIMDRNSRRSKGVGYIEFYDAMSVPMAIALSGHLFMGQPIMVKPSEAEKNLVQSTSAGGGSVLGPNGATDRKLYVGNLHFNMSESQLKEIFGAFGPIELVQLPLDLETGHCKGFGFIQFQHLEHAKAAQSLNGKLDIAGRIIKVSSVTDHVLAQESGTKTADFDDDEGGGLALNAQARSMLMAKLDRSGIASSVFGSLNGSAAPAQQNPTAAVLPNTVLPTQMIPMAPEPIGTPSECLLLKNMFDPAAETEPDFDLDIRDDVEEECSKYGRVKHIHVDRNSAGYVYLRFDSTEAASRAQLAMHKRWFARRLISAIFLQPYEYDAKFKGTA